MDAVSLLNEHIDIAKLMEHYRFDHMSHEGNMIRACCMVHGGDNPTSFVANPENNLWFCHTNCGGGDAYTLVMQMENIPFKQSVEWLANFFHIDIANLQIIERKAEHIAELRKWIDLMRKRRKGREVVEWRPQGVFRPIAKLRTFQEETLEHFGVQYVDDIECFTKDGRPYHLQNRILCPIVQNGVQVGGSLRRIKSADMPKWLHQPANIVTGEMLYNIDALSSHTDPIVLVEGIYDVWAYYELNVTALCTFGAHLTDEQYRIVMRSGRDVILSYDGDEAGRLATLKAKEMLKHKVNLWVVNLENGEDPESIGREGLYERYERKTRC